MRYFFFCIVLFIQANVWAWDFHIPTKDGNTTWTSRLYPIPQNLGGRLQIDWTAQFDTPIGSAVRLNWFDVNGKRINQEEVCPLPLFLRPGNNLIGKTIHYRQAILRSQIPLEATQFQLTLRGIIRNPEQKNVGANFLTPKISWPYSVESSMPYNWFELKKGVDFTCSLPSVETLKGVISDSAGNKIAEILSREKNWHWNPTRPGFFTVAFFRILADGREVAIRQEILQSFSKRRDGGEFLLKQVCLPRNTQNFVVAATSPRPIAPESPFGFNSYPEPNLLTNHWNAARLMNFANALRLHAFRWNQIEKTPGVYDWDVPDKVLAKCQELNIPPDNILINTIGTPKWNSTATKSDAEYYYYSPKDFNRYGRFLAAFSKRFPQYQYWELWNEPHLDGYSIFWQKSTPAQFVKLLKAGYLALKKENPKNIIVSGGIGMRYMPWYNEFLKEDGNQWCDYTGTHGGYDLSKFRALEKSYQAPSKPFYETEWHANLFECRQTKYPTQEELGFRMLVNLSNLLLQGQVRIMVFLPMGKVPPELASEMSQIPGISQIYGLFRSLPSPEPRFEAYLLRVMADRFTGKVTSLGAWTFADGAQTAAVFESKQGKVMTFWINEGNHNRPRLVSHLEQAVKKSRILDWEGNPATPTSLQLRRVYYAIDPDLSILAKQPKVSVIPTPRPFFKLDHSLLASYTSLPEAPRWIKLKKYISLKSNALKPDGFQGRFAVSMDQSGIGVTVEITDKIHNPGKHASDDMALWNNDSVQIAIDTVGKGDHADAEEFIFGGEQRGFKLAGPTIGGDLPVAYSEPRKVLRQSSVKIKHSGDRTFYHIRIPASDLYPYFPEKGKLLRFAILVNNNNGNGREGYLEWGTGIGSYKNAATYGSLTVATNGKVAVGQDKLKQAFQQGKVSIANKVVRVDVPDGIDKGAGVSTTAIDNLVPGGRYRISWLARGKGQLEGMFTDHETRINLKKQKLTGDWQTGQADILIPIGGKYYYVSLFEWKQPSNFFEIKDFQIKGL